MIVMTEDERIMQEWHSKIDALECENKAQSNCIEELQEQLDAVIKSGKLNQTEATKRIEELEGRVVDATRLLNRLRESVPAIVANPELFAWHKLEGPTATLALVASEAVIYHVKQWMKDAANLRAMEPVVEAAREVVALSTHRPFDTDYIVQESQMENLKAKFVTLAEEE